MCILTGTDYLPALFDGTIKDVWKYYLRLREPEKQFENDYLVHINETSKREFSINWDYLYHFLCLFYSFDIQENSTTDFKKVEEFGLGLIWNLYTYSEAQYFNYSFYFSCLSAPPPKLVCKWIKETNKSLPSGQRNFHPLDLADFLILVLPPWNRGEYLSGEQFQELVIPEFDEETEVSEILKNLSTHLQSIHQATSQIEKDESLQFTPPLYFFKLNSTNQKFKSSSSRIYLECQMEGGVTLQNVDQVVCFSYENPELKNLKHPLQDSLEGYGTKRTKRE